MSELNRWSITSTGALQNSSGYWPEGQAPSTVNDAARTIMAEIKRWQQTLGGEKTATYTGQAYAVTYDREITAGELSGLYSFVAETKNTGSATLNINALGAKVIRTLDGLHLQSSAIPTQGVVLVAYNKSSDCFNLLTTIPRQREGFRVTKAADQSGVVTSTWTTVAFDTETYDVGGHWDTGLNQALSFGEDAIWLFTWAVGTTTTLADGDKLETRLLVDSIVKGATRTVNPSSAITFATGSAITLVAAGNTVELQVFHNKGSNVTLDADGSSTGFPMFFAGERLR